MPDNALRCIEEDYPVLVEMAKAIGVLDAYGNAMQGCLWDYIGYKKFGAAPRRDDELDTRQIVCDPQGRKYVHVNVRTPFSVGEAAAGLAASSPEIAAALGDPSRFFVTDANGQPVDPQFPMRVFP